MSKIRVMVCDDLVNVREYFISMINERENMEVVASVDNGVDAVRIVNEVHPDIVLMDIQMEDSHAGINATKAILEKNPDMKVVIITIHAEDEYIIEAFMVGAVDYLIKTSDKNEICDSIVRIYNNEEFIRPFVAKKLRNEITKLHFQQKSFLYIINMLSQLTKTEMSVLKELYAGKSQKEIARQNHIELVTVKFHVSNILRKLRYKSTKNIVSDLRQLEIFEHFYRD